MIVENTNLTIMDFVQSLQDCCKDLNSNKISYWKRAADNLDSFLANSEVTRILNEGTAPVTWNDIVRSIHFHFVKQSEKLQHDTKSKSNPKKKTNADLLVHVVRKANTGAPRLNVANLLQYVLQCFDSTALINYYFNVYILILKDYILPQPEYLGCIVEEDWIKLLSVLQRTALQTNFEDAKIAECIKLIFKYGPKHRLPLLHFRNQFDFVEKLCQNLERSLPTRYKTEVFQIVIYFCKYNAPDCCMSCCKLGENVFLKLHGLYERRVADDSIKELLFKFCLLQIRLHHPHGATSDSTAAYAYNASEWRKQLRSIYRIVEEELNYYAKSTIKPPFLYQQDSVFVSLAVAVCKQVFSSNLDIGSSSSSICDASSYDVSQPAKRLKLDLGLGKFLSYIKQTKNYLWIYIMTELLKTHPEIVNFDQSVELLEVLVNLYKEDKEIDMQRCICECFTTLVEMQNNKFRGRMSEVDELWSFITNEMLTSLALRQNASSIHSLLQSLISNGKVGDPTVLYQTFLSGGLLLENYTINTLLCTINKFGLPDTFNGESCKKKIIKWMTHYDEDSPKVFAGDELLFAQTLVSLCLKQWLEHVRRNDCCKKRNFEDVYALNSFQSLALPHKEKMEIQRSTSVSFNKDLYVELVNTVKEFVSHFISVKYDLEYLQKSLSAVTLVGFILAEIYTLDTRNDFNTLLNKLCIEEVFQSINEILYYYCSDPNHIKNKMFPDALKSFKNLLTKEFNPVVSKKYRTYISTNLLGCFIELLNLQSTQSEDDNNEEVIDKDIDAIKRMVINILCNYSMYKGNDELSENESKVIQVLVQYEYEEYDMLVTVLSCVKNCQAAVLDDEILAPIMKSLQNIWKQHSTEYKAVLKVLKISHALVHHIGNCTSVQLNLSYCSLLIDIFNQHQKYGYKVGVALLDCFQTIFKDNYHISYKRYTKSCLSTYICNFLKSNYQLVRIKAVECLVTIFRKTFNDPLAQSLQKSVCDQINLMSREVFTIGEQLNPERVVDENVSRTCSVFQTYSTLIVCNSFWRKKLLYALLALTQDQVLSLDLLKPALNLVALKLQYTTADVFVAEHVTFLLSQWFAYQRPLSSFPYGIAGCESQAEFYKKYTHIIIPLQLNKGVDETNICKELGLSVKELFDMCFVQLVTPCFLKMAAKSLNNKEVDSANKLYGRIVDELSEEHVRESLLIRIDNILVSIMTSVLDEKLYEEQFDMEYVLESNEYPRNSVDDTFKIIQMKAAIKDDLLEHCVNIYAQKIQSVMIQLTINVYTASTTQDKLKSLHQYFNFIDIITPHIVKSTCRISDFCIRTIIHTVLYFIEMKCETISFNITSCGYLRSFIQQVISNCHKKLEKFFNIIISKLMPLASDEKLSQQSISILKLMIVENTSHFKDIIPYLDPLPQLNELTTVNHIYQQLCTEKWGTSLLGKINQFLESDDSSNLHRLEALKHLKQMLAEKKSELRELFEITSKVRDFFEERRSNTVHRLICVLVKLASSEYKDVNIEAACCLGEIGASNITTLILQSEDMDIDRTSSPIQLLTSHIATHLYQSIVDQDVCIVKYAGFILYEALNTKEGQHFIKNAHNDIDIAYLQPFILQNQKVRPALVDNSKKNRPTNMINVSNVWWYTNDNHKAWITELVCTFLQCFSKKCYLQSLIPLCQINVSFCEKLLPYVIHLYASTDNSNVSILSQWINYFFDNIWDLSLTGDSNDASKVLSAHCMLDAIHFSRIHAKNSEGCYQLSLNYLKLAQAAFYCSRFFDSIFYVELWCQSKAEDIEATKKFTGSPLTLLDLVCELESPSVRLTAQNILRQSYNAIGEVDALNGCGHAFLLDASTRIDHYKQLGRWDQVVLYYDTLLSKGELNAKQDFSESLKNCGYYGLAMSYQEANNLNYDALWRLGQYDCDTRNEADDPYEKHKYIALKSLLEKDKDVFSDAISKARLAVIDSCKGINLQTTKVLYGVLTRLQMLQELEDVDNMEFSSVIKKWKENDAIPKIDFKSCEPIKAQRVALLTEFLKRSELNRNIDIEECKEHLADLYLDLSESARKEELFNIAKRAVTSLSEITEVKEKYAYKKVLEEAQICWAMKDKVTARYLIHELFTKNNNIKLNFASLKLYGKWMAETHSENPQTILTTYFLGPLELMKSVDKEKEDIDNIFETYYDIARFSDLEYQRIRSYVKSTEFEKKVQNKTKSREAAEKIKSQGRMGNDKDQQRAFHTYLRQSVIDEAEINRTIKEQGTYLTLAIKYYMLNLQYSDANNTRIFRVLSLWLENRNSDELKKMLDDYVSMIPSYKFVSILPQLVPHLSHNPKEDFANHIASIVERCAKDHPHHTLPILLSLANSNMDEEYVRINSATDSNEVRVEGAQKLLTKLKCDPSLKKIISEMQLVSDALLELAYLAEDKCRGGRDASNSYIIPDYTKITKVRNLSETYLPTIKVEIKKDCQYKDVVSIHSFKKEFMGVGGINAPKSIFCQCSNGMTKQLLVKGRDDLRQDAVMQQVFTIMNDLFRNNKHTSKLLIGTYKVVPLSKRSGVIEWVENSQRIGDLLIRLHNKHRPKDWTSSKCQSKIKAVSNRSTEEKERVYKEVCANFMPVMHKFFEEQYPHPSIWYERRRAYTHSLATTSISGYILGLGDRHVANILLDENTAEVIHIDFGIAFEQGRVLPTPETVPFRLTRDLEDGMGVTGVTGTFKRSCEKTMEVLRQNWETITSILEVLLYDPLYAWTITTAEAYSRQNYDDDDTPRGSIGFGSDDKVNLNVTAERALLRLRQKLHGTEEGGSSSVEGQVEKLIQQARDPSNLSRLFCGWQAYL